MAKHVLQFALATKCEIISALLDNKLFMEKIPTNTDPSEALINSAVENAREALSTCSGQIEIHLPQGQWSMAEFQNEPARVLEAALENTGEHSGATFTLSLQRLVAQIESDNSFTIEKREDGSGNMKVVIAQA